MKMHITHVAHYQQNLLSINLPIIYQNEPWKKPILNDTFQKMKPDNVVALYNHSKYRPMYICQNKQTVTSHIVQQSTRFQLSFYVIWVFIFKHGQLFYVNKSGFLYLNTDQLVTNMNQDTPNYDTNLHNSSTNQTPLHTIYLHFFFTIK